MEPYFMMCNNFLMKSLRNTLTEYEVLCYEQLCNLVKISAKRVEQELSKDFKDDTPEDDT